MWSDQWPLTSYQHLYRRRSCFSIQSDLTFFLSFPLTPVMIEGRFPSLQCVSTDIKGDGGSGHDEGDRENDHSARPCRVHVRVTLKQPRPQPPRRSSSERQEFISVGKSRRGGDFGHTGPWDVVRRRRVACRALCILCVCSHVWRSFHPEFNLFQDMCTETFCI